MPVIVGVVALIAALVTLAATLVVYLAAVEGPRRPVVVSRRSVVPGRGVP
jgi:hypothetical protein